MACSHCVFLGPLASSVLIALPVRLVSAYTQATTHLMHSTPISVPQPTNGNGQEADLEMCLQVWMQAIQ